MALAERHVRLALGVVAAAAEGQNGAPFGSELIDALLDAVPAENVEYVEWPFHKQPTFYMSRVNDFWGDLEQLPEIMEEACPTYPLRDIDLSTSDEPLRITDLQSTRVSGTRPVMR